jgi:hypothetical protein
MILRLAVVDRGRGKHSQDAEAFMVRNDFL